MKKEDLLQSDFFKQFKTTEEFQDFFSQMHKCGVEAMLECELDVHLVMINTPNQYPQMLAMVMVQKL